MLSRSHRCVPPQNLHPTLPKTPTLHHSDGDPAPNAEFDEAAPGQWARVLKTTASIKAGDEITVGPGRIRWCPFLVPPPPPPPLCFCSRTSVGWRLPPFWPSYIIAYEPSARRAYHCPTAVELTCSLECRSITATRTRSFGAGLAIEIGKSAASQTSMLDRSARLLNWRRPRRIQQRPVRPVQRSFLADGWQ